MTPPAPKFGRARRSSVSSAKRSAVNTSSRSSSRSPSAAYNRGVSYSNSVAGTRSLGGFTALRASPSTQSSMRPAFGTNSPHAQKTPISPYGSKVIVTKPRRTSSPFEPSNARTIEPNTRPNHTEKQQSRLSRPAVVTLDLDLNKRDDSPDEEMSPDSGNQRLSLDQYQVKTDLMPAPRNFNNNYYN
jgi:hypothetical protein